MSKKRKKRKKPKLPWPPPTYEMLTVCWKDRTVEWRGHKIAVDPATDCFTIPVLVAAAYREDER